MKISRTYDLDIIKKIMFNPVIWKSCAEDGQTQEEYKFEMKAHCWLILEVDEKVIGAYNIHANNAVTLELHAHVLPEFRKQYAFETGDTVLKWILEESPDQYQKLVAQIPAYHKNVIDFTLAHGFKKEGINRLSYKIDGKLYDQCLLGITRSEIEDYLRVKLEKVA